MITEKPAWLWMAVAFATDYEDRTLLQFLSTQLGCCDATGRLRFKGYISHTTCLNMKREIEDCLPKSRTYFYPTRSHKGSFTDEHDALRADFCYLMHYSCEDGNNERI